MNKTALFALPLLGVALITNGVQARPAQGKALNKVAFQLNDEQWVNTDSAQVTVRINAALNKGGLATIHQQITNNLNKLADSADWHITQFNRSRSQSGLEQVQVMAQARLAQSKLGDLRAQAKSISKPGEVYTVSDIQYKPSLAEVEKVRAQLRAKIYQQAGQEVAELNKIYPKQHYYVHGIYFQPFMMSMPSAAQPQPRMMLAKVAGDAMPAALPTSQKASMTAQVILASKSPKKSDKKDDD